jgi:phosphomannomutase
VDGTKLYLANDNWAQLRFSGTEPVLRLAVEADSPEKARDLIAWLKQFVSAKAEKSTTAEDPCVTAISTMKTANM